MESVKSLALATFTPSETEEITGVSQATQRDWRRRELTSFETRKGRKRFTSSDLAHLVVMNQLLPQVRPGVAYQLARMSCGDPISILAERAYPSLKITLEGEDLDRKNIHRYAVYCRFMDGKQMSFFTTSDLNMLPKESRKPMRHASSKSKYPVAFYVIVDLSEIADQLQLKQTKPYFIDVGQEE
jgi:hypothetical protein